MNIRDVNLESINDGEYVGSFSYGGFEYSAKTIVSAHRITLVKMLQNRNSKHAKRAEAVLGEILERQTPNVDAVSGATTTSKAIMKAVENSLVGSQ